MSNHEMRKYNIKSYREVKEGLLISSIDGDEWLLKADNTLLHIDNRRSDNKVQFHHQCTVKSLHHCLCYIKSHSQRLIKPNKRMDRISYLFSII